MRVVVCDVCANASPLHAVKFAVAEIKKAKYVEVNLFIMAVRIHRKTEIFVKTSQRQIGSFFRFAQCMVCSVNYDIFM